MCIRDRYMGMFIAFVVLALPIIYIKIRGSGLVRFKDDPNQIRSLFISEKFRLKTIMARFSYLFISYDAKRYYWEGISTLWSSLVVVFSVYIPYDASSSQTFSLLFIPFVQCLLQYLGRPYLDDHLNSIAMKCVQCLILTAVCCLGLRSGSKMNIINILYAGSIWILNGCLLIYIFISLRAEAKRKIETVIKAVEESSPIIRFLKQIAIFLGCGKCLKKVKPEAGDNHGIELSDSRR
eukprot:TRINITY_DN10178_c0_g1_i1.p1 TRINITY_DN10178_c0_g1~~TRINITY_DN10178_c0_g1_i1.p1  ORF type:complete len:237 (+),score=7.95 TRINITY_DN10178_c0_g1_i1:64-774(+)